MGRAVDREVKGAAETEEAAAADGPVEVRTGLRAGLD